MHEWFVKAGRAQSDTDDETWKRGGVSPTLNAFDNGTESRATVLVVSNDSDPIVTRNGTGPLKVDTGLDIPSAPAVLAFSHTQGLDPQPSATATPTLRKEGGGMSAMNESGVRRLTPKECERLQGFPDDWTAGQPDAARYRQMGNAVAVPVVEWIVRRLLEVDREV